MIWLDLKSTLNLCSLLHRASMASLLRRVLAAILAELWVSNNPRVFAVEENVLEGLVRNVCSIQDSPKIIIREAWSISTQIIHQVSDIELTLVLGKHVGTVVKTRSTCHRRQAGRDKAQKGKEKARGLHLDSNWPEG